jgi:hypothetical protein
VVGSNTQLLQGLLDVNMTQNVKVDQRRMSLGQLQLYLQKADWWTSHAIDLVTSGTTEFQLRIPANKVSLQRAL